MRKSLVRILQEKGISEAGVLQAIGKVPRHYFFDDIFVQHAYQDKAFPIGEGQTISQPYTVAFQTVLLEVKRGQKILEIGTGSGYQACILCELGANLYTIEYNRKLYETTCVRLPKMGYQPHFFHGDGSQGLPKFAPFDGIIVTAGAPTVPASLVEQLKIGGRLVIPVGNNKTQKMMKVTRTGDRQIKKESFDNFSFVPLLGQNGWQ